MKLKDYINQLESFVPEYETKNLSVSKSSVGWQLDHSLKVINGVIETLKTGPTDKKPKIKLSGRIFLSLRYIPRGAGKAPERVLPPEIIKQEDLINQLERAKSLLPQIQDIHKNATFKHPYFGVLTKKQTVKFIEVHTKHHLKIIKDILKN